MMKRITELDGLRGLAALTIVGFHLAPGYFPKGGLAVDLFFVLSGYLISSILLQNRDDPGYYGTFYARRGLRIWPIYYLSLFFLMFVNWKLLKGKFNTSEFWEYLFYMQNVRSLFGYGGSDFLPSFSHTWTLALEEQFYLLWPFFIRNMRRRSLVAVALLMFASSVILRGAGVNVRTLPAHADGFALGSLLALMLHGEGLRGLTKRSRLLTLFWLTLAVSSLYLVWLYTGPRSVPTPWGPLHQRWSGDWVIGPANVVFFAVIGLVILHAGSRGLSVLRWSPLTYVGMISYGLYLYHVIVMSAMELVFRKLGYYHTFGPERPLYRSLVEFTISLAIAALSWQFLERPILRLKDRFAYRREPHIEAEVGDEPTETTPILAPSQPAGVPQFPE